MAAQFSNDLLQSMGFRTLSETESIAAKFHFLHVYEVRGLTLEEATPRVYSGIIAGLHYDLALGASVNAVCRALVADDFSDDEHKWREERKCQPPYMVVHIGPTGEHRFAGTHCKIDDSGIHTFDGFSEARLELEARSEQVLPSLFTGLASSFTSHESPVKFLQIDRAFFGITSEGQTVLDTRFQMSGTLTVSSRLTSDKANEKLESAIGIATGVKEKVARFFHLALNEDDPLKRFLYFFLAVEIETHATFATIEHAQHIQKFVLPPQRAAATAKALFSGQREKWTTLGDRFSWSVLCMWTHLSDSDVDDFVRVKKIRDQIAHGSIATPPADAVLVVEKLAAKLQLPLP
jgi:hypothetical protein